jgi:hypothetical protein
VIPFNERLRDVQAKVERVGTILSTLETDVNSFLASQPFEVAAKREDQTRQVTYYAARVEAIPPPIAATAGDALHNLRSALDYLVVELIRAEGNNPTRHSGFPIFASFGVYQAQRRERIQGIGKEAMAAIGAIKPYRGGNAILWSLQSLCAVERHRLVGVIGVAIRFKSVTPAVLAYARKLWNDLYGSWRAPELFLQESAAFIESIRRHFRLTAGDVIFVSPAGADPEDQPEFSFDLAFGEGETGNLALLETLRQMVDEVGNIVTKLRPLLA